MYLIHRGVEMEQKSNLSFWIGSTLQQIMPPQKELALLLIVVLTEIGTEVSTHTSQLTRPQKCVAHFILF